MSGEKKAFILHRPFGKNHPYDHELEERFPREPIAGETVNLGVKTNPENDFEVLWGIWREKGSQVDHRVEGHFVEKTSDYSLWIIPLPHFEAGAEIIYRIQGKGLNTEECSEWFNFSVSSWVDLTQVISASQNGASVSILLSSENKALQAQLVISEEGSGNLNFHFSQVSNPSIHEPANSIEGTKCFKIGGSEFSITGNPVSFSFHTAAKNLEMKSAGGLSALVNAQGQITRFSFAFESPLDEAFYGFGERFNALDQRGNSLVNRVVEQYKNQGKRTYYPVPFFVSSRGFGLWIKTDREVIFDIAETQADSVRINSETADDDASLEFLVLTQGKPQAVIAEFTRITGRPQMPPSWVFGLWMSSNEWNTQAEVERQIALTEENKIPATVLVIEAWADEVNFYIWNDAQYKLKSGAESFKRSDFSFPQEGHWPDPQSMIDMLHNKGVRLILWQIPVVKQCKPEEMLDERQNRIDQEYLISNQMVVVKENGDPYRVLSPWFINSLLPDFTNPETENWWFKQREYLVSEMGIDGFKTDGGEHLWLKTTRFSDGTTGKSRINSFPSLYISAYDRFLEKFRHKDRFLFSRAGYTGVQKHPGHWAGDENSNWGAFRASLFALMSMGISGEPFIGWDIAGFSGDTPSAELYIRAAAFSVFCPIFQYHSENFAHKLPNHDRTPWNIQELTEDQRIISMFRDLTNLRMNLLPYIQYQAWQACQTGLPIMRALPIEYPDQIELRKFPFEYMFGDALLVAPVVEEGKENLEVRLPAGKWRDFWTHEEIIGPQTMAVQVPRDGIPVYQREGSIVALNLNDRFIVKSDVGNMTEEYQNLSLRIFPGQGCQVDLVRAQGEQLDHIAVECKEGHTGCSIDLPALDCPLEVIVYTTQPSKVTCDNEPMDWQWLDNAKAVRIHLNGGKKSHLIKLK
ncbi:MAG: TIM-barrel domain-containing protein [Anaerolineaceae bacterium]